MDDPPSNNLINFLWGDNLLYIFLAVLLLFFAGLFSIVEAAFFALTPDDMDAFKKQSTTRSKPIVRLVSNPRLLLTVLTAWKYVTLISTAVLFTVAVQIGDGASAFAGALVLSLSFAFFGVILPKVYGATNHLHVVERFAYLASRLISLMKPFVSALLRMSYKVERKLEEYAEENSVKELTQALELAAAEKEPSDEEKHILEGIVNFGTYMVRDVMRPKAEINSIDADLNFHDLLIYIKRTGFSRIPVHRDSIEKIEGVLYIKDLLPYLEQSKSFEWQKMIRPAYFVHASKKIDLLLKEFQEKRVHMAIVTDDDNNVVGLLTLEDIIEEIVGDIHDEFDEVGAYYKKIDEKTFVVDSKIPVNEFCRILDIEPSTFGDVIDERETLGVYLQDLRRELPKIGDQIIVEPLTFVIEAVDHKRIKKLRVQINSTAVDAS